MKIKKAITLFMTLLPVTLTPMIALGSGTSSEFIVSSSETRNAISATIEDIDALVEERNQAYLNGDYEEVANLTAELRSNGMSTISLAELNTLTGNENTFSSRSGTVFETVYSTYITAGKSYDIMRVYATPTTGSDLYMTGVTAVKNSVSALANAMKFIGITAEAAIGLASDSIGVVQTVYGALQSYINAFSPTTTVTNISSSYTWNVGETCVFVYVKSTTGEWVMGAQYSKATASVTVVTPTLEYGTNGAIASAITKYYSGSATPTNYNDTAKAVNAFLGADLYDDARITRIVINGIEGKTVETVNLVNPDFPGMIN